MIKTSPSPYGIHRVITPENVLPQGAWQLDNTMDIANNEILIEVNTLNIDAASFTQIKNAAENDVAKIAAIILDTVKQRGKMHNPVTGSGGMLIGKILKIGERLQGKTDLLVGDKIATLVSLSLTPLQIDSIKAVHLHKDQVEISGQAVLFETGLYAKLPPDIPENMALAILDVAGAPAQTERLVQAGDTVVVVGGGGKSGTLCTYVARQKVGERGCVIGVSPFPKDIELMRALGWVHHAVLADASRPIELMNAIAQVTHNQFADVVINCVNVPNTEMGCILATKERGKIYFFSMATSFTAAALGAEGVGKDIDMMIGNGYAQHHAKFALELLRQSPAIRQLFTERYL